ncbi:hypothetical protein BMS3Bbin02_01307 [bacterium BMS3Bbin02]|nr:hypothetical protein BMS3Bbin02_01307 [bacterium BMS3Bbin02]
MTVAVLVSLRKVWTRFFSVRGEQLGHDLACEALLEFKKRLNHPRFVTASNIGCR